MTVKKLDDKTAKSLRVARIEKQKTYRSRGRPKKLKELAVEEVFKQFGAYGSKIKQSEIRDIFLCLARLPRKQIEERLESDLELPIIIECIAKDFLEFSPRGKLFRTFIEREAQLAALAESETVETLKIEISEDLDECEANYKKYLQ